MAALSDLRAALAAALVNIPTVGLQVSAYMLANPHPPTLWVLGPQEIEYHVTSHELAEPGGSRWQMVVQGISPAGIGDVPAQKLLDAWLSTEGTSSVSALLEADPTLGGKCDDLIVRSSIGYQVFVVPDLGARVGCEWLIDIYV